MKLKRELASATVIDVMEYYANQLEQISRELDFAWSRLQYHYQRIVNGNNSLFERWFYSGAYERCNELIERARAVDQAVEELKESRAYIMIMTM